MAWSDVDLSAAVWTIPATKAKNKRAHRVPLALPSVRVLEARKPTEATGAVFPGLYHQRKDLRALGTIHGDTYRWHDLRRTVASRLAALGYGEDLIGRVLNHAKRGVTATVYNQYAYDAEKRAALEHWARTVEAIVKGDAPALKVLRHRPRRRG
jgi:integrase